jgi:selenium metabolism protein YedF
MSRMVDTRGLACPQPVILTRRAMSEPDAQFITTIVDNDAARHNVSRMATRAGYSVEAEERDDGTHLHLRRRPPSASTAQLPETGRAEPLSGPLVLLVSGDGMGQGSEELAGVLIRSFLYTLGEVEPLPDTIIFLNSGVKLTTADSPVLEDLRTLEERGMELLACGTCLDYYGLSDELHVGEVSNMYTIAETMLRATKVLTL